MNHHTSALEMHKVLKMLAALAGCDDTRQLILDIKPAETFREAVQDLQLTSDAHMLTNRYGTPSVYGLRPCSDAVGRAARGGVLSNSQLLDIATLLSTTRTLIHWRRDADELETSLDYMFSRLEANKGLEDDIRTAIISEDEISDRASSELADIRRKIRLAGQKARDQLDKIIRSASTQKYLQDQLITLRDGRFVVPVKSEYRSEIKGLVHDTSSSGATLFVEPIAVVEQNNQIRELQSREQHEIDRILREFSARVGENSDLLLTNYDMLLQLDMLFAKSRLADEMRASVPTLLESGETKLIKARHPLIDPVKIVPIDISIGGDFDTVVITGPNTGGKTVALKTLGLLTIMAMCGLMLPVADESTVCFYSKVLADIGDEQSIEQSLSTFSAHMTNIVSILKEADSNTLVLMDELGAGTDPVEGAALAVAIIDELRQRKAKIAATTHYAEIKMYALQTDGVENASCEFDVATLRPTYRLLIGVPGRSNAFAISERLGLSPAIIDNARQQIGQESTRFEDVVSGLEEMRQQLEQEKATAGHYRLEAEKAKKQAENIREELEEKIEKELEQAKVQARGIIERVRRESGELIAELEELKKQKDNDNFSSSVTNAKSAFRSYMNDLEDNAASKRKKTQTYNLPRKLKRGDRVFVSDFNSEGTVLSDQDGSGYVQVQTGIIKTKIKVSSLRLVDKSKVTYHHEQKGGSSGVRGVVGGAKSDARSELDLRGMDSGEAIVELARYLDNSVLAGMPSVTIIHGKGTGVLRDTVQKYLRKYKGVRSYRLGTFGEGESGVTIAELK